MPEGAASEWRQAHSGETRTHAHKLEGRQLVDKSHKKIIGFPKLLKIDCFMLK